MIEEVGVKFDRGFKKDMGTAQNKTDFGISDAISGVKKKQLISMSGDVLFKDIQLFIPELVINISLLVFGVLGIVLARLLASGFLVDIDPFISEQAMEMVAGQISFLLTILTVGVAIPICISFLLFAFKWFFFYPRGKKQIVIRAWKMGVARISVEEVRDNEVSFEANKSSLGDKMHINYSNKGIDYYTSRPILLLEEGQPENTPLHKSTQTNEKVKDKGNVTASIFSAALKFSDYQKKKAEGFFNNPANLILLAVLGASVVSVYLLINQPDALIEAIKKYLSGGL